jgi:DNA-binding transcriptional regulator YdaS (Cro superfamily)
LPTVYVRALKRAAQIVGGREALAAQLDVPMDELAHWMEGSKRVPDAIFLRVVDIVSAQDIAEISGRHANLKSTAPKD